MAQFIVIEGLEGAGKSTAVAVVKDWLQKRGVQEVLVTREPGGTPIAEKLREMLKSPWEETFVPLSELLLMYAARVQLVNQVIKPALAKGTWVIGDRHELSTRAYQGGGRGISGETLQTLYDLCLSPFKPHVTLYLDIPPEVGFERIQNRGPKDRIEQEELSFFRRVRQVYSEAVNPKNGIFLINAYQLLEKVHADISSVLNTALEEYV